MTSVRSLASFNKKYILVPGTIAAGFVNLFRSVNRADRELDDTK